MKTRIITLESHDDLISIRDRLSWAKTPRILLVVPKYVDLHLRQVDLKVLQRHAVSLGAQLGLVTRQNRLRAEAEAAEIPVFDSTKDAQRGGWSEASIQRFEKKIPDKTLREKREQVRVREEAWRANPIVRVIAFMVGVLSVMALTALFIPRAQVRLIPEKSTQRILVPVSASPSVNMVFLSGSIPAREKRVSVSGQQSVVVTGEGVVAQSKAQGLVEFRNLTQDEVEIPAGTIVLSGDLRFLVEEDGVVDGGVGKTVELPIEAVEGGTASNLDAETIDEIEGRLGLSLSVSNPEPITGGRERSSVQATDADRARAKELLLKSLDEEARAELHDLFHEGDVVFDDTFELVQIISETYDQPSGAAATQLTLNMQVEYSIRYASASDLTELASLALNSSLPPGYLPGDGAIMFNAETEPSLADDGSIRWTMRVERQIVQHVDAVRVGNMVAGLPAADAQSRLEEIFPVEYSPRLTLSPSWWPWVPIVPFRIEVVAE